MNRRTALAGVSLIAVPSLAGCPYPLASDACSSNGAGVSIWNEMAGEQRVAIDVLDADGETAFSDEYELGSVDGDDRSATELQVVDVGETYTVTASTDGRDASHEWDVTRCGVLTISLLPDSIHFVFEPHEG